MKLLSNAAPLGVAMALTLALAGCAGGGDPTPRVPDATSPQGDTSPRGDATVTPKAADASGDTSTQSGQATPKTPKKPEWRGFEFTVTEGGSTGPKPKGVVSPDKRATPPKATPLGAAEVARLLKRVKLLKGDARDKRAFALRAESPPAPRKGQTLKTAFPPPPDSTGPSKAKVEPLRVLRFSPEGDVPIAPRLSVTFSQPMVAITAHDDTVAAGVPVKMTPTIAGKWRWLGTKTLVFEPKPRLPMATSYTVTIPKGTKSILGGALAKTKTFAFRTPPPQVKSMGPTSGPQRTDVRMYLHFDQAVDFSAVASRITVTSNGKTYAITPTKEIQNVMGKKVVLNLSDTQQRRFFRFKTKEKLPKDAPVTVILTEGVPSLEGPRTTASAKSFSFRTYAPLAVVTHRCGWNDRCFPTTGFQLKLNNPLDHTKFDPSQVTLKPALPDVRISGSGRWINLRGRFKGNTTYTVTLTRKITDAFQQRLAKPYTAEFKVQRSQPYVSIQGGNFVTLDPHSGGKFSIYSMNMSSLPVKMYRVAAKDWPAHRAFMRKGWRRTQSTPPGTMIFDGAVTIKNTPDTLVETAIDLNPALDGGYGHVILQIEEPQRNYRRRATYKYVWVQSTQMGLEVVHDGQRLVAWANRLTDGKPMKGIEIEMIPAPTPVKATTDAGGIVDLALPDGAATNSRYVIARNGKDHVILPENLGWWSYKSNWKKRAIVTLPRWFHYTDRNLYKPGEKVRVKGWVRGWNTSPTGGLLAAGEGLKTLNYRIYGARGNTLGKGTLNVNAWGGFDLSFDLPKNTNLGSGRVQFKAAVPGWQSSTTQLSFKIQEFRRPEFEVKARASEGPHLLGSSAAFTVKAKYYAGGSLPNAPVAWKITARPGYFSPPNYSQYIFGTWVPWWQRRHASGGRTRYVSGKTSAAGEHRVTLDFKRMNPPRPMSFTGQATVTDVNRQGWSTSTQLLMHPASHYVGIRSPRSFVERKTPIDVDAVVVDLDGKRITGSTITMKMVREAWVQRKGAWKREARDPQDCVVKSGPKNVRCTFKTPKGGRYRLTATIKDAQGRANQSERMFWVPGGERPPERRLKEERVTLIPDKKTYASGETAKILVNAPFYPAEGLLTIARQGIIKTRRFTMKSASTTLTVKTGEALLPGVTVRVDLVGAAARLNARGERDPKLAKRPAYASGNVRVNISTAKRVLTVKATPQHATLSPGSKTHVDVVVTDADGKPVPNAEVALVVVDEAILALAGFQFSSPAPVFYAAPGDGIQQHDLRRTVLLVNPDAVKPPPPPALNTKTAAPKPASTGAVDQMKDTEEEKGGTLSKKRRTRGLGKIDSGGQPAIAVRRNFDALAHFAPSTPTDAAGKVRVAITLPDNLTRYRVVAYAVTKETRFGLGESAITAKLPLMVRPSPPRFLNFGDRFEFPVVLQNQTDRAIKVKVAMQVTNLSLTAGDGRQVTIPANDRVEVRFPMTTVSAGTARYQLAAVAGKFADAQKGELPVWTPATTEAFATYGVVDKGLAVQAFKMPTDVVTTFGALQISTSSTAVQALTDAVIYLVDYPYGCSEQISSRVLAIAGLRDVLSAFEAPGLPSKTALETSVSRDLKTLSKLQAWDGGMPFWRRGDRTWPYITIHVAHAAARAKQKGYKVPAQMQRRFAGYLKRIENKYPGYYSPYVRRVLSAYALYVRFLMGDKDVNKAKALFAKSPLKGFSLEAIGWMMTVLSGDPSATDEIAKIRRYLQNKVTETASGAHFVNRTTDDAYLILHSSRRADGVLLEALIRDQPKSDLIPKIVRGLLAHRKKGRWGNTQENAFILLALDKYFNTYEKQTPDFVAKVWLGKGFAGAHAFKGRTTDRKLIEVPMNYLAKLAGLQPITLQKVGAGRMYYRIGLKYAPKSLKLKASDHGFTVLRRYEAIDDKADVSRAADGGWRIKAGARVRVHLTMVAQSRRYHVALVDKLPAGLEPLNPALATTGSLPAPKTTSRGGRGHRGRYWWWSRTWYEHQNMRDERVEAFASLLWGGVHTYSYIARATTPGTFVVPPAKAEEMYTPETFGRSASDMVIVN